MNTYKALFLLAAVLIFFSCGKKDDEVCLNSCPPRSNKIEKCECRCSATWGNGNLVNAGGLFCTRPGSFVAFLPKQDHLDTFSLNLIQYSFGFDHEFLYRENINVKGGSGFSYVKADQGDSIIFDMMQPADFAFHLLSGPNNRYDSRQYRLRFEGFIPGGWDDGDVMHATVHYWTLADNPVRPSIEFDMIKVTEDVE